MERDRPRRTLARRWWVEWSPITSVAAAPDVAVCEHVADAVEHVDALVMRAGRN